MSSTQRINGAMSLPQPLKISKKSFRNKDGSSGQDKWRNAHSRIVCFHFTRINQNREIKSELVVYHERRPRLASLVASVLGPGLEASPHRLFGTCFVLGEISLSAIKWKTFLPLKIWKCHCIRDASYEHKVMKLQQNQSTKAYYLSNQAFQKHCHMSLR